MIYSKQRVPQRCIDKIESVLKENALGLLTEKNVSIGKKDGFANSGISLPFPKGLYRLIKSVKADIVIAEGFFQFTPWALAYAIFNRKPILIAYERTAHTERNCPTWRRMYRKFVNLFVDGYVVNGILTKQYLVSQGVSENVIFTGRVDIISYMEKLDFTILTSISEGQPLSVLESFAARRPCVTTDVGCCRELLNGNE